MIKKYENIRLALFTFLGLVAFGPILVAQRATIVQTAQSYIQAHHHDWGLSLQDVTSNVVSSAYIDDQTGIGRVYLQQHYDGIPVHNAILNVSMTRQGELFHVGNRFVSGLSTKVNSTVPALTPQQAIEKIADDLDLQVDDLRIIKNEGERKFIFDKGRLSYDDIEVSLCYQMLDDKARLAWSIEIGPIGSSDLWSIRVDAVNGKILDKHNLTVYCDISHDTYRHIDDGHECTSNQNRPVPDLEISMLSGATYNVWPVPAESPKHGPRVLVTNPADPVASPYGWHDVNGVVGAEYTITRGNNVHAYEDSRNTNQSVNNEPNGGENLVFDFPYDASWEPQKFTNAAVVNLFYASNFMHDFSYHYGFTEQAGNFQENNYGKGGTGNDWVRAEAQDGGGSNNANFSTPSDGKLPRMQMYLFNSATVSRFLTVNKPASVAGVYNTGTAVTGTWGTGAYVKTTPVTGDVVVYNDGVEEPFSSDACQPPVNADELKGKIALIDRGGCEFGTKVVAAQNAGAIAVIICNFLDATLSLGAGAQGINAKIPVVSVSVVDCQTIRQYAGNGLNVTLVDPGKSGPSQFDGDLDNGIIFHEYGHGISHRLTGGPATTSCLNGDEQMGEGWSDFMTLVTTVQPGDKGTKKRGVGTYSFGYPIDGRGIRAYPYSTDLNINPLTYGDLPGQSIPHGVGTVWASMLWDLYWAMVDVYGWDPDLFKGKSGNNMTIRLVFEGMKNQPCSPGFVDGRDAIIAADKALYGGANECLIWGVFARRGLGYGASQGKVAAVGDEVMSFKTLPACMNSLAIEKNVTPFIQPGEEIEVKIKLGNFKKETAKGVVVSDEIPVGASFKTGSSNVPVSVQGSVLKFNLDSMLFLQEKTVTYKLTTPANKHSVRYFIDDVPHRFADDNWDYYLIGTPNGKAIWQIADSAAFSGQWSWFAQNVIGETRMGLELKKPWRVTGNQPTLRFYHMYNTETGKDGGLVDVKEIGTTTWRQVDDKMIRNGYPGYIAYNTFVVPNLKAYTGSTNGKFIGTYVDLKSWAGKDILLRFRFGADAEIAMPLGWFVDDIEFMDLLTYNGEACLTTNQGDKLCATAPEKGTIVDSKFLTNTKEEKLWDFDVVVYPNPARNYLQVGFNNKGVQNVGLSLYSTDGRLVYKNSMQVSGTQVVHLDLSDLNKGFYFLKAQTVNGVVVKKVVLE